MAEFGPYRTVRHMPGGVTCTGKCGMYGTVWYVQDSVVCTGQCGMYGTVWYVHDKVSSIIYGYVPSNSMLMF